MSPKRIIAIAALALTGAASIPAVAHAAGDPTAGGPPREIVGGYAFKESWPPQNKPLIAVVFKATGQLPRRFDGLIRANATLDGSGGSIAERRRQGVPDVHVHRPDAERPPAARTGRRRRGSAAGTRCGSPPVTARGRTPSR